ncbi:CoA transferase [Pigmentiphaga soli]|uniref:CoA transferase n=1 Tax=Pigmentiphaga soli TaxID=1007095 RepID=A0ABP8HIS5_9BURK
MSALLDGITVLDLSRVLAGPYCAQLLADQGASVVKVESPEGDECRAWGSPAPNGLSHNFNSVNRGKRSITLNLKSEPARGVLRRLAGQADVVIQSFLPDTARRLGVDYDSLRAVRPDLVFCSVSGFGSRGPLAGKPGYDLTMQAFSGIMSLTGHEGQPPVRSGVSFIDMTTGLNAYAGVTTALLARERTGRGAHVQVSLLETAIALLGYHGVAWLQQGIMPRPQGSGIAHLVPYQAFRCADGWLLAGATNDAAWRRFAQGLGRPDLADDPRFATNQGRLDHRGELVPLLEGIFASGTVAGWVERLQDRQVAVAPLHDLEQALGHPQVLANDMVVTALTPAGQAVPLLGCPFKFAGEAMPPRRAPPPLGADTADVLAGMLGLDAAEIEALRQAGAL